MLINKEPEPNPEDPSQPIYDEDPLILHTPTGRIIDYVDDEEHGIRLFWQPPMEEGKEPNPDEAEFLPLGFDEFYGRDIVPQDNWWIRLVKSMENKGTAILDGLEKWAEEKKKAGETKIDVLKKEVELMEAELDLKEAIEDLDEELKLLQQEEENKVEEEEEGVEEEEDTTISKPAIKVEAEQTTIGGEAEEEDEEDQEEEDEDDATASSFGSVGGQSSTNKNEKGSGSGKSTFAAASLTFGSSNLVFSVSL